MDDGTAPVINNILPAFQDKDLQGLGGSRLRLGQSFAFSWSLSASSYWVFGPNTGGAGKGRVGEEEEEEEGHQLGPSQSPGQLSWVSDTKTGD